MIKTDAGRVAEKADSRQGKDAADKEVRLYVASQWQLVWWRFTKHKVAVISLWIVALLYVVTLFVEVLAPYSPNTISASHKLVPPQRLYWIDANGNFSLRPFVYPYKRERNPLTLAWVYSEDRTSKAPIKFFISGDRYKFWGLFESDIHLFGVEGKEATLFLLGTDRLGRDLLSRIIYGTRISMSIGLVGVAVSLILGIFFGGISGYFGGWPDLLIQRVIEVLQSVPSVPLYMALAAAMPLDWQGPQVYFAMVTILSFIGWSGMARVVRGKFLSLREEAFIKAARLSGAGEMRIILRHMVPSFLSHIIASISLAIPGMILSETALSFLGIGMRPPAVSWGVLLQEAQNIRTVAFSPWLLTPGVAVVAAVLAFNFLGDGLRDAADPYG